MSSPPLPIRRVLRRVAIAATLGTYLRHLAVALWVLGVLILLGRLFDVAGYELLALLAIPPLTAWLAARGRFIDARSAATWLDTRHGGDGSVVTALETGGGLPEGETLELPRYRLLKPALLPLPAAAFAVIAALVPIRRAIQPPSPTLTAVERLEDKLEVLEEVAELEEEEAAELHENLDDLEDQSDGEMKESAFEAIDSLEQQLGELAEELQESAKKAAEEARNAAQSSEAGEQSAAQEAMAEALKELAESGLAKDLPPELAEMLEAMEGMEGKEGMEGLQDALSKLSEAELQQLAEALQKSMAEKMAALQAAELVEGQVCDDPSSGECQGGDPSALVAMPGKQPGEQPGKGGVDRGKGDAELTWGDEAANQDGLFAPKVLPPGSNLDFDHSVKVGEGFTDPEAAAIAQAAGAVDVTSSQGDATWSRRVAPRHREAVGEFFATDEP